MPSRILGVDEALQRTFGRLADAAGTIFGYPVRFSRGEASRSGAQFRRAETGELCYGLPGRDGAPIGELILPNSAYTDSFATTLATRFAKICMTMAQNVRSVGDVRIYLLRHGKYIWDNLVVSRTHSGQKKIRILETIGVLRDALNFRYEGAAVDVGVMLTWDAPVLEQTLAAMNCVVIPFAESIRLPQRLAQGKASYLLADGITSFYVTVPGGRISYLAALPARRMVEAPAEWELVPPEYRYLKSVTRGHDVFVAANHLGDLWLFTSDGAVKWANNRWYRATMPPLSQIIASHAPTAAARIAEIIALLSKKRLGALLIVTSRVDELLASGKGGLRSQFDRQVIAPLLDVSVEFAVRLASIDGATIIDTEGNIVTAGVILEVPAEYARAAEGARSAAAAYASDFGIAIKVSHDGPITVYDKASIIRQAA